MNKFDLEKAQRMADVVGNLNPLEIAKLVGEPLRPEKEAPYLAGKFTFVDTCPVGDRYEYFDRLTDTDLVLIVTSTGAITQVNVTPDTPAEATFIDAQTNQNYVKLTQLASSREKILARKKLLIETSLDAYENQKIVELAASAAAGNGAEFSLTSGDTAFDYENIIDMLEAVEDYGDQYIHVAGASIIKDMRKLDYIENKNQSVKQAVKDLNIETTPMKLGSSARSVTIDSAATDILATTKSYLIAKDTTPGMVFGGNPMVMVRKLLNEVEMIGTMMFEDGRRPQRLVLPLGGVVQVGATGYLGISLIGFEEVAFACVNGYAVSSFERA